MGLNKDFDIPVGFEVLCNAPPSMFAYPKVEEKKEEVSADCYIERFLRITN